MAWGPLHSATLWPPEVQPAVPQAPHLNDHDALPVLMSKLSSYFTDAIQSAHTFEEMRLPAVSYRLNPLIDYIVDSVHARAIVHALLALKRYFTALENDENRGINQARGYACEYVAWRFTNHLSGRELIHFLLYELPSSSVMSDGDVEQGYEQQGESGRTTRNLDASDATLLDPREDVPVEANGDSGRSSLFENTGDFVASFDSLNALEVAAVSDAKKFLSQRVVQRVIAMIWKGDIIFWETLDVGAEKVEAKVYNKRKADPYCRLRVPRYLKTLEALWLISFIAVYLAVLVPVQRNSSRRPKPGVPPLSTNDALSFPQSSSTPSHQFHTVTMPEALLYLYLIAFTYDEFGEYTDAGRAFYATDFWSIWDLGIIAIGLAFFVTRMIGLHRDSTDITGTAFDILALLALFLIPRLFSILSLNPYFGTIIPCLREMTKDFFKFLSIVAILYLGFLVSFTLLARDNFSLRDMSWILVKVFFGSSYLGFDVAQDISPYLGPPLMLIFITLTNILLITSLISLLSNSLTRVLDHAKEEYLFINSIFVLEASTSNRLTYFFPPLNLIPLLLRPLRIFVAPERLRRVRILLLKITHAPLVAAIWICETTADYLGGAVKTSPSSGVSSLGGPADGGTLKRATMRNFTSRPMIGHTPSQSSLPQDSRAKIASRGTNDGQDDLRALVLRLSAQIDDLKSTIAQQQLSKEPSD